jgi:hypothetical protein
MSRVWWGVIAAATAVVVVALVVVVVRQLDGTDSDEQASGAEAAVRDYLELIADGKGDEAHELESLRPRDGDTSLLTDEVLGAAGRRITDIDVRAQTATDTTATVTATYHLGSKSARVDLHAKRTGTKWRMSDTLAVPVRIVSTMRSLDRAYVGDTEAPVAQDTTSDLATFLLYPGEYTVHGEDTDYLSTPSEELVVLDEDEPSDLDGPAVELRYDAKDSLADAVTASLGDFARNCVALGPPAWDRACEQVVTSRIVSDDTELALVDIPRVEDIAAGETDSADGVRFTSSTGKVRVTDPGRPAVEVEFQVRGSVTVSGTSELTITYADAS